MKYVNKGFQLIIAPTFSFGMNLQDFVLVPRRLVNHLLNVVIARVPTPVTSEEPK